MSSSTGDSISQEMLKHPHRSYHSSPILCLGGTHDWVVRLRSLRCPARSLPRAGAGYDRDNRFCQEDFDELKAAGYLKMALPKEFGGLRLDPRRSRPRDAPAGAVRAGDRALPQHAQLLGRHRRRRLARRRQLA